MTLYRAVDGDDAVEVEMLVNESGKKIFYVRGLRRGWTEFSVEFSVECSERVLRLMDVAIRGIGGAS